MDCRNLLKMNKQLFDNLPFDVIVDIFLRLPVTSVVSCRRVCKSWHSLLGTHEFVMSYNKSTPSLAVICGFRFNLFKLFDGCGFDKDGRRTCYKAVTRVDIPSCKGRVCGSANGLLFLRNNCDMNKHTLHICNPVTRDYIELNCNEFGNSCGDVVTYGFGCSKTNGQYKVVRISQEYGVTMVGSRLQYYPVSESVARVYDVGMGLWRQISRASRLVYDHFTNGVFVNGSLYWLVSDLEDSQRQVSCFDLETEHFGTFTLPVVARSNYSMGLCVFEGSLCLYHKADYADGVIDIWLMKDCGVEKSWKKQYSLRITDDAIGNYRELVCPIKYFEDGHMLIARTQFFLLYCMRNETTKKLDISEDYCNMDAFLFTPSFLSLKNLGMQNVRSF